VAAVSGQQEHIQATHPRIWLTPQVKSRLQAKKSARDPSWLRLKARADTLATYKIYPYIDANRTNEPSRYKLRQVRS
jgi:hypothetical protein